MAHDHEPEHLNGPGYETEDADIREVIFTGLGLAVGTIVVCLAVIGLFRVLRTVETNPQPVTEIHTQPAFPPGPRLQEHPWLELRELRKNEDQLLTTYGWVNKDTGTVRIPVDRAMELVVQRGLPVRDASASTAPQSPAGRSSNARKP